MKPVRIIRHQDWIEAGHLTNTLERRGIPYEVVALDEGRTVPQETGDVSALAFLGCTHSLTEDADWMRDEIALIRKAADAGLPILGHCFGSQLISAAFGGEIVPMSQKEIGWHRVKIADSEAARSWCGDTEDPEILIWHHDAFTLPEGADPLYSTDFCPDQAFAIGDRIVGTVAHVEATPQLLKTWLQVYGDDIDQISETVQSADDIRADLEGRCARMHVLTDRLYDKWIGTFM
ncbi:glutamine amidotransferase [Methyloligella halotolerans]|uniref:Glutamine amidotransferase n=1 Tax=Methyloligella halotolerans TaxID=1177755 RepID=A0A1E2RXC6_9HYPH|nr:type 1 glutamine amidotransferase [Methyloligella halotolerans]ODA66709.1 glutamine amidotransferase [Methyloligella halotolerans]